MATRTSSFHRHAIDHFEPQDTSDDPHAQRRMRGHLEQIDYTAFASNKEVIGAVLGHADSRNSSGWPWPPPWPGPNGSRRPWP